MLVDGRKVQLTRNPGFHCGRQGLPRRTGQLGKLGHAYGDLLVRRSPNMSPVPTMQRAPGTARHPCHETSYPNGDDLRRDPLEVRKATLASIVVKASSGIRFNEHS